VAFVLGAIITPTFDPINQTLVAIPIILLYEIGFLLVWIINKGNK
jgi:sec-independent protein translocase protein TatC